jgi:Spy/CpxP family protein refolding chaperone
MKQWAILTAAVAIFALAMIAYAEPAPPQLRPRMNQPRFAPERLLGNQELLEQLGLEDQQIAALKEVHREAQKAAIELRAEQELAQIDIKAQLESDEPDREAIMQAIGRAGEARTAMRQQQMGTLLTIREILGPEAWRDVKERMQDRVRERVRMQRDRIGDRPGPRFERDTARPPVEGGGDRPQRRPRANRPDREQVPPPQEF